MNQTARLAVLAAALLLPALAAADIAPMPPEDAARCDVTGQRAWGEECAACAGNTERCSALLLDYGFDNRCSTGSGSREVQIWCRYASGARSVEPIRAKLVEMSRPREGHEPAPRPSSCASAGASAPALLGLLSLAALALRRQAGR